MFQIANPGLASGDPERLLAAMADASHPIGVWIGPQGAKAFGFAGQIAAAADHVGAAPGTSIGYLSQTYAGGPVEVGTPWDDAPYATGTVAIETEGDLPDLVDVLVPTIGQYIVGLDGLQLRGATLETATTIDRDGIEVIVPSVPVAFEKPDLVSRTLRLAVRPDAAFFFLVAGLALVAFEFYAAGVGVTAAVAAASLVLAGYGLAVLPMNWLAVAASVLGVFLYNWDFQRNELGIRSIVGTALLLYGGLEFTAADPQFGPRIVVVLIVVAGLAAFYLLAMTTIVRSRYSTPTIGREHLVGRTATAETTLDPDGIVDMDGARWRARTSRAAGVRPGDPVTVRGVAGIVLEVEPVPSRAEPR